MVKIEDLVEFLNFLEKHCFCVICFTSQIIKSSCKYISIKCSSSFTCSSFAAVSFESLPSICYKVPIKPVFRNQ